MFYINTSVDYVISFLSSSQLNQVAEDPLKRPVVYVKGNDAVKLMNIVNKQKVARARIQHRPPRVRITPKPQTAYSQMQMTSMCVRDKSRAHVRNTKRRRTCL